MLGAAVQMSNWLLENDLRSVLLLGVTGKQLESLRLGLDLSQEKFAQIVGVTRVTITTSEAGKPSRNLISFIDLALSKGLFRLSEEQTQTPERKPKRQSS